MLVRAFVRILLVERRLRTTGLGYFLGYERNTPFKAAAAEDLNRAVYYAACIELAARHHPVRARCLHRSLALLTWLQHDGLEPRLRIGVRKEAEVLKAHAWVELGGYIVNDAEEAVAAFAPLVGLDSVRLARGTRWDWDS